MTKFVPENDANYQIRLYRPGDEVGILKSFNHVFREVCGPDYVDRELVYWEWQFGANPCGHRISVGLTGTGEVAAHYGGVPQRLHTSFGDMTFVHIVDSFVVPEHRAGLKRPGLFVKTAYPWFDLCYERGDAVMYGYPVKAAERVGSRYLEYKFLRVVDYLCRPAGDGDERCPGAIEVEMLRAIPPEVDALFERFTRRRNCLVRRDRAYLEWRYVTIPDDHYEIWAARRDGELSGLCVLRPFHELLPGSCGIADWIVPDDDAETLDALLATATGRARAHGRQTVLAVFADPSPEHAALRARGFRTVSSAESLERRLTYRIYDERLTSEWLAEHWWYTLGDTDLV